MAIGFSCRVRETHQHATNEYRSWCVSRTLRFLLCVSILTLVADVGVADVGVAHEADAGRPPAFEPSCQNDAVLAVDDVVLGPGGVLNGRVPRAADRPARRVPAGCRVILVRGGRVVGETQTDIHGGFALRKLSGGVYQLFAETPSGPRGRTCRLWTPTAAPQCAAAELHLHRGDGLTIRGQGPLLTMGFRRAAIITAIAVGAVATPVIYHNIRQSHQVPHSP